MALRVAVIVIWECKSMTFFKLCLRISLVAAGVVTAPAPTQAAPAALLVEAEDFQFNGDWMEDRDATALGSRILRTQGANAVAMTVITVSQAGKYHVWVRARDYAEQPRTRRYKLAMDGVLFEPEFGAHGSAGWKWEKAGER